jgi:hypothetical protein
MRTWIHRHGQKLGVVALTTAMVAVAVPVIAVVIEIPFLFDPVPRPSVISIHIALAVGTVFAILGFGSGLTVWILRAPGHHLGMAAVLVLGAIAVMAGGMLLTGLLMSAAHSEMRA